MVGRFLRVEPRGGAPRSGLPIDTPAQPLPSAGALQRPPRRSPNPRTIFRPRLHLAGCRVKREALAVVMPGPVDRVLELRAGAALSLSDALLALVVHAPSAPPPPFRARPSLRATNSLRTAPRSFQKPHVRASATTPLPPLGQPYFRRSLVTIGWCFSIRPHTAGADWSMGKRKERRGRKDWLRRRKPLGGRHLERLSRSDLRGRRGLKNPPTDVSFPIEQRS